MNTNRIWARRALVAACVSILASAAAGAEDVAKGELWETTAQATVPGMPVQMPPYKGKICQKKDWKKPPQTTPDASDNCKATDFVQTPAKITWKMVCANPPMTGDGEINFNGTDAYTGMFTMHSEQFDMKIDLSGKKVGTCDNPE